MWDRWRLPTNLSCPPPLPGSRWVRNPLVSRAVQAQYIQQSMEFLSRPPPPVYRQPMVLGSQPKTGGATGSNSSAASNGISHNKTNFAPRIFRQPVVIVEHEKPTGGATGSHYSPASNGIPHDQTSSNAPLEFYSLSGNQISQLFLSTFSNNAKKPQPEPLVTIPICHGVKMKRLPFYDIVNELIGPCSLLPQDGMNQSNEASFPFRLTARQASEISESREYLAHAVGNQRFQNTVQVLLRFCSLDTSSTEEKKDQFPPNLCVKVNSKQLPLPQPIPSNYPGVESKRPSKPLQITSYVRLSPIATNTITVKWASDNSRGYAICVYLVRKLTSSDLLTRLERKGPRPVDYSRGLIKELIAKDDGDCMIAMTSLKVSISCPLGKCRMSLPCRATTCKHLQCFDANLFLQMNERKPTWICPVCDKPTLFDDLSIDGYFQEVISKMSVTECMDVELLPDGSWRMLPAKTKNDRDESNLSAKKMKLDTTKMIETINLDDNDEGVSVLTLTISSDEESDDPPVRHLRK